MNNAAPWLLAQAGDDVAMEFASVITFVVYIAGVMVLAWLSGRLLQKKSFLGEYFLGSRGLGMWAFALTFAATSSSGGSFMGFPSLVYTHGWVVAMWIGSYMIVPIVSMGLLAKRINQMARRTGAITIPDVLRDRFESRAFGTVAILLIVFLMAVNLIAQFKSGGVLLKSLLDDLPLFQDAAAVTSDVARNLPIFSSAAHDPGYLLCLLVFTVVVVVYTAYGGFRAVVWTDVMQGFVMVGGVLLMLPLALGESHGLENVTKEMAEMTPPQFVSLRLEAGRPVAQTTDIPRNTWLVKDEDGRRRVFRTSQRAEILEGTTVALPIVEDQGGYIPQIVEAIELTYEKQAKQKAEEIEKPDDALELSITVLKMAKLNVNASSAPQDLTTVAGGAVVLAKRDGGESKSYRILKDCYIPAGKTQAAVAPEGWAANLAALFRDPQTAAPAVELTAAEQTSGDSAAASNVELTASVIPGSEADVRTYKAGAEEPAAYVHAPGPSASAPDGFLPLSLAISFFCMWTFSGAGQPSNMVRLMAFKEAKTLRRSIFTVSIYYSLIYFPLVIIFCCARVLLPGWESESDSIMPEMAGFLTKGIGAPWLAGLLLAAPFAAVMSTMDSFLLMISSALVRDVYQRNINPEASEKKIKTLTYAVTVAVGVAAMLAAVSPPKFLQDIIVFTGSGLSTSFLAPVFLMLYWPRFNKYGALSGMLCGFGTHIGLYVAGFFLYGQFKAFEPWHFHPFLVGACVSFLISIGVTLVTPPPPPHLVKKFFHAQEAKA